MNPRSPTPEDFENLKNISDSQSSEADPSNLLTEQVADAPFSAKRAEIEAASFEPVRCETCDELIPMQPGVVQNFCNKTCRKARTKRGQKQLLTDMRKSGVLK